MTENWIVEATLVVGCGKPQERCITAGELVQRRLLHALRIARRVRTLTRRARQPRCLLRRLSRQPAGKPVTESSA
jgi:hypothetical protein